MAGEVAGFFSQLECRHGRRGRDDHVHFCKCLQELLSEKPPHLLGLQIIGIVVAGAERISSQQNAPLDLGAKTFIARVPVHGRQACRKPPERSP